MPLTGSFWHSIEVHKMTDSMETEQACYMLVERDDRDEWLALWHEARALDMRRDDDRAYFRILEEYVLDEFSENNRFDLLPLFHELQARAGDGHLPKVAQFFALQNQSIIHTAPIGLLYAYMPIWFRADDTDECGRDGLLFELFEHPLLLSNEHVAATFLTCIRATPRLQALVPGQARLPPDWVGEFTEITKAWAPSARERARALGMIN